MLKLAPASFRNGCEAAVSVDPLEELTQLADCERLKHDSMLQEATATDVSDFKDNGFGLSFGTLCSLLEAITPPAEAYARAITILSRYHHMEGVMMALSNEFVSEEIFTAAERHLLLAAKGVAKSVLLEAAQRKPLFDTWDAVTDYLRVSLAHERREMTRLLFLDGQNRLIADELHSVGSVDHVPIEVREIVRRALVVNARKLLICHNHPSGNAYPSDADIELTLSLIRVLGYINVEIADHLIMGLRQTTSLKKLGYLGKPMPSHRHAY